MVAMEGQLQAAAAVEPLLLEAMGLATMVAMVGTVLHRQFLGHL
jgi:hypothetical protein